MRFSVINLGCKVNRVESDQFIANLKAQGWELADSKNCDVIILNTCTVTGEAEKKTRKAVRRALRDSTSAYLVVTGCAAVISPHEFEEMSDRVIIEPNKSLVEERINQLFCAPGGEIEYFPHENPDAFDMRMGSDFATRVGIKIQDGCNNACTFCIVHKARGKAHSRDFESVVDEAVSYSKSGVQELVLTGINVGSYQWKEYRLSDLLSALLQRTSQTRFRLSSIEPHTLDATIIDVIAQSEGRICRHLHLPLQSGSTSILKKMGRPYSADDFLELVRSVREKIPSISLSADVIVGFPSETEEDFEKTLQLCAAGEFSKIHVFPYSKRKGTPAAEMPDQIAPEIKKERATKLSQLSERLGKEDMNRRKGKRELALVESQGWATTESYHRIKVDTSFTAGDLVTITL